MSLLANSQFMHMHAFVLLYKHIYTRFLHSHDIFMGVKQSETSLSAHEGEYNGLYISRIKQAGFQLLSLLQKCFKNTDSRGLFILEGLEEVCVCCEGKHLKDF